MNLQQKHIKQEDINNYYKSELLLFEEDAIRIKIKDIRSIIE